MKDTIIHYEGIQILPSLTLWKYDGMVRLGEINNLLIKGELLLFYTERLTICGKPLCMYDEKLFESLICYLSKDSMNTIIHYHLSKKITHNEMLKLTI